MSVAMSSVDVRNRKPSVPVKASFRPDIEGLRAVAVVLVVVNHLAGWPSGGFVGVDVFFVISGYLISGQLVRERLKSGWISFAGFYARRLRRIVPVATLVVVVVIVVGYLTWYSLRANQTALDGLSAQLWVSNWHFARNGTDYLQGTGSVSPFQHYWSLSVEEQFYVFWPWALLGLAFVLSRLAKVPLKRALLIGIILLGVVSFTWAVFFTAWLPQLAYFDTVSRVWEFAAGAAIAMITPGKWRFHPGWLRVAPFLGLITIIASALLLTGSSPFPGPWAILPVLGSVLIIAGNEQRLGYGMAVLTNPVSRYLGRISYSLYLWHAPVIIFIGVYIPSRPELTIPLAVAVMLALSQLSYRFVEVPFRRSNWLRSWESRGIQGELPTVRVRRRQGVRAAFLAIVVLGLSGAQIAGPAPLRDATALASVLGDTERVDAEVVFDSEASLRSSIESAAHGPDSISNLVPSLDILGKSQAPASLNFENGCMSDAVETTRLVCEIGDAGAPKTALVIGDSITLSWVPVIAGALPAETWKIVGMGIAGCGPYDSGPTGSSDAPHIAAGCLSGKEQMYALNERVDPDVIFISSIVQEFVRYTEGAIDTAAQGKWTAGVASTLKKLQVNGAHVVLLTSPPTGPDMRDCPNKVSGLASCHFEVSPESIAKAKAEEIAVIESNKSGGMATFVDGGSWFCSTGGDCPPVIGNYVVRFDAVHMTNAFGQSLAKVLAAHLADIDLTGG